MQYDDRQPSRRLRWAAVAAVASGIFAASIVDPPGSGLSSLGPFGRFETDKWLHALAYAVLAGTLAAALSPGRGPAFVAALAGLLAIGYGVGIEVVQAPLATRHFSIADVGANAVGASVAVVAWRVGVGFVDRSRTARTSESET